MDEIIEYEKKYLILSPIPFKKDNFPHQKIKQRYIQQDNKPVQRLRSIDNISYKLTQKYNNKRVVGKVEHEIDISYEQFISLKEHCIPAPYGSIRKCRYHIPYGNYMIELDCFEENMDNIIIAEVEFTSIDAMLLFTPPDRFGPEVTTHISNKKLYLQGPSCITPYSTTNKKKYTIKHHPVVVQLIKRISKTKKKLRSLKDAIIF